MSGDPDNFFRTTVVRSARKQHACVICRGEIARGAAYTRVSQATCGLRTSYAAHDDCLSAALDDSAPSSAPQPSKIFSA